MCEFYALYCKSWGVYKGAARRSKRTVTEVFYREPLLSSVLGGAVKAQGRIALLQVLMFWGRVKPFLVPLFPWVWLWVCLLEDLMLSLQTVQPLPVSTVRGSYQWRGFSYLKDVEETSSRDIHGLSFSPRDNLPEANVQELRRNSLCNSWNACYSI